MDKMTDIDRITRIREMLQKVPLFVTHEIYGKQINLRLDDIDENKILFSVISKKSNKPIAENIEISTKRFNEDLEKAVGDKLTEEYMEIIEKALEALEKNKGKLRLVTKGMIRKRLTDKENLKETLGKWLAETATEHEIDSVRKMPIEALMFAVRLNEKKIPKKIISVIKEIGFQDIEEAVDELRVSDLTVEKTESEKEESQGEAENE